MNDFKEILQLPRFLLARQHFKVKVIKPLHFEYKSTKFKKFGMGKIMQGF